MHSQMHSQTLQALRGEIEAITTLQLATAQIIWPAGRPHAVASRMVQQAPFSTALSTGRIVRQDRRQFRVFDGGKAIDDQGKV